MSNHRPPNDPGPSVASIVTSAALTLAAVATALYILWGPMDSRGVLGAGLGFILAVLLMTQTLFRYSERLTARDRVRRWEARQQRERVQLRPVFSGAEMDLAVQHGWPVPIVQGNPMPVDTAVAEHWGQGGERPDYLIQAAESTLANQARTEVPPGESWRVDETQAFRLTGEDETRRLTGRQVHGPSAAALKPIAVPVFRTEVERASWAGRYDLPTEVLPLQPES